MALLVVLPGAFLFGYLLQRLVFDRVVGVDPAFQIVATFGLGGAILGESALALLGFGVPPPYPSWGAMLNASRAYLRVDPWMAICPGVVLALLLLGLNYLADALREAFDPRRVNAGF